MDYDFMSFFTFALFMILPAAVVVLIYAIIFVRRGRRKRQRITSRSGRHREAHKEDDKKA